MVCLQESKLSAVDQSVINQCCGTALADFCYTPAHGTRGGIIVAWNPDVVPVIQTSCPKLFISADIMWKLSGISFKLITVYGPQSDADKLTFCEDIKQYCCVVLPCFVAGDFNLITRAADKNSSNLNRCTITAFRRFINDMELGDMFLHGQRYTWSNEQLATEVKLDRLLLNNAWIEEHLNCILHALPTDLSDHFALLLTTDALFWPSRHFRIENYRPLLEGLQGGLNIATLGFLHCDLSDLECPFTADEVKAALMDIFSLGPDKASGPDGFTGYFFQICWNIIKDDVLNVIRFVDAIAV